MTNCNKQRLLFPALNHKKIEAEFTGGDVSSDGGVLLLREVDRLLQLTPALSAVIPDKRNPDLITHTQLSMLKQRIYGLALGYEDLNDHHTLRKDPAFQTAIENDDALASSATLCRLEKRAERKVAFDMHRVFVEKFIGSFNSPPEELVLDFDATDDPVHGHQEGRFYHGYYREYCFLPLYVFCNDHLLVSYLRSANRDQALHSWAILKLLVKRFRQVWPSVSIIFRGDGGFCRHKMFSWCERHDIKYIVGLAKNSRLLKQTDMLRKQSEKTYEETHKDQRLFGEIQYAAETWSQPRRIIVKAEHTSNGANPRFVVTNLPDVPQDLYEHRYCERGNCENRIKEQFELFSDRTSCHKWWPNQFRLLLSSAAYILVSALRRNLLANTELATAQCNTIRLKLFKIGTVIIRNTRRIRFLFSSSYPYQELFSKIVAQLCPG